LQGRFWLRVGDGVDLLTGDLLGIEARTQGIDERTAFGIRVEMGRVQRRVQKTTLLAGGRSCGQRRTR
jgi:hypothetical protein